MEPFSYRRGLAFTRLTSEDDYTLIHSPILNDMTFPCRPVAPKSFAMLDMTSLP